MMEVVICLDSPPESHICLSRPTVPVLILLILSSLSQTAHRSCAHTSHTFIFVSNSPLFLCSYFSYFNLCLSQPTVPVLPQVLLQGSDRPYHRLLRLRMTIGSFQGLRQTLAYTGRAKDDCRYFSGVSVSHTHYQSQNIARMLEIPFQAAGNGYLKAGNGLVGHNSALSCWIDCTEA